MDLKALSRRKFLKTTGALGAAAAMTACLKKPDPYSLSTEKEPVPGSDKWYKGEERILASACAQCPVNCGIKVRVVEGRAVKINGNPASLQVGGKLGPKGQTGLFTLYDPDRIKGPMKRDGERGSGKWKEISWEDAISEVSDRLSAIRNKSEPHKLAVVCGRQRGFMKDLLERFCQAYGTPNFFDSGSDEHGALLRAMELMTGINEIQGYDANNTSYILSLGSGIFESTCNGIHFARSTGAFRRDNPTRRSKIIQVEPHRSMTASVADEWIKINPGTYDVLALGIANQLVKANLHDRDFIESQTFGFEKFLTVLEEYPADKVSQITGIPEKDIYRMTWELAESKPAVVVVDGRSTSTSNGLEIARCALALNALLGNIERPGGIVTRKDLPLAAWPELVLDEKAKAGLQQPALDGRGREKFPLSLSSVDSIPESVLAGKPYDTEALFLYYSNPVYSKNDPIRFNQAFEKIPFIVSFSPFLDESAHLADLILPDHTYLERWEEALPPPFGFQAAIGIRRPVVEPLYKTKHSGDVVIKIAHALELSGEPFPWKNFKTAMEDRLGGIADAKRGSIVEDDRETFLKKLTKEGYWNDEATPPENWKSAFKTSSGKFEFYSHTAEDRINRMAADKKQTPDDFLKSLGKDGMQTVCVPHAEAPNFTGSESQFPLVLIPYKDITYSLGSGANIPYLTELSGLRKGLRSTESWQTWVEIHPQTAARMGLEQGDAVRVESVIGKAEGFVLVTDATPENTVLMALGKGHTQFGRFAKGKGANAKNLLAPYSDSLSGLTSLTGTRVRIAKA